MRILTLLFVLTVSSFLQGCAIPVSDLSANDRQRITSLMIGEVTVGEDPYMEPTGKISNGETVDGLKEVGGMLLPGLADLAVEGISLNAETQRFQTKNKAYFQPAKDNIPDLQALIKESVTVSFEQNEFFSERVQDNAPYRVEMLLNNYGFEYIAKRRNDAVMGFVVVYTMYLKDPNDKEVFNYFFIGESTEHFTMRQYANDPKLVQRTVKSALTDAQYKLDEFLNKKIGKKG